MTTTPGAPFGQKSRLDRLRAELRFRLRPSKLLIDGAGSNSSFPDPGRRLRASPSEGAGLWVEGAGLLVLIRCSVASSAQYPSANQLRGPPAAGRKVHRGGGGGRGRGGGGERRVAAMLL